MYAAANDILGNVVKVTPSSKVVGDLALALVAAGADPAEFEADPASYDVPDSVIGFLNGELGDPPGGWPEPFRTKALAGPHLEAADREPHRRAAGQPRPPTGARPSTSCCSRARRPRSASRASPTATCRRVSTIDYLYGLRRGEEHPVRVREGREMLFGLEAISEPDERGIRNVMATVDGQMRPVQVRDRSISADVVSAEKADPTDSGHVAAPYDGAVTVTVAEGDSGRGRARRWRRSRR